MSSAPKVPAVSPRRPSLLTRLLAIAAPGPLSEPLAQAQFALELSRSPQLQQEPEARKAEVLAALRLATVARLRRLRRGLVAASVSTATALLVAYVARTTAFLPMPPRSVLAVGSPISLAAATLAYLWWRRKTVGADAPVAATGPRLHHVLYWIGVCWGALAIL